MGPLLAACPPADLADFDLVDSIAAADRLVSWAVAQRAGRIVELAHRRLDPVGPGVHSRWQEQVNEFCVDEIALALHATRRAADGLLSFAVGLDELPRTRPALAGRA